MVDLIDSPLIFTKWASGQEWVGEVLRLALAGVGSKVPDLADRLAQLLGVMYFTNIRQAKRSMQVLLQVRVRWVGRRLKKFKKANGRSSEETAMEKWMNFALDD